MNIFKIAEMAQTNGESNKKHFLSALAPFASTIGSVVGAGASILGSKKASSASAKQAQQSQQHSDYQLQNRHQWEVRDLRKAGRNPILYSGGSPSAGSSAMAQTFDPSANASSAASTALDVRRANQELKNLRAQEKLLKGQANNQNAQASSTTNIAKISNPLSELVDSLTPPAQSTARGVRNLWSTAKSKWKNRRYFGESSSAHQLRTKGK